MSLTVGTRLGVYEVGGLLGAGGMGEVYRARDTTLGREVALKILPDAFASDPDRLARFAREAQVLASLNHPGIAAIYAFEKHDTMSLLVMELVEGPTLADRIAQGAIPLDEALPVAKQLAEALAVAHDQGIVHRDLKPANVKVRPDGTVKVLDFGLAKAMDPGSGSRAPGTEANSPTISLHATQAGIVLGTAAYMSPEQAKGRVVDRRADLWAFGAVLYEMLSGRRAFSGEDISETLVSVLRDTPDWTALPADTPPLIRRLLRRCLEKDRKRRLDSAADATLEIDEALTLPGELAPTVAPAAAASRRVVPVALATLAGGALVAALGTWVVMRPAPQPPPSVTRFTVSSSAAQPLAIQGTDRNIAISPDGAHIVYRVGADAGQALVVRPLNGLDVTTLVPTGGRSPFISPDGQWVGFFAAGELRKVSITGGPPITICKISATARGASWGPDDTIVFAVSDAGTGLQGVPASGGEPKVLTAVEPGESGHFFPFVLPGGRAVLFTIAGLSTANAQVAVLELDTGKRKTVIRGGSDARYIDTGHLLYAAGGALRAVRFDLKSLAVAGGPVPVGEEVSTSFNGVASMDISRNGTLVYLPDSGTAQAFSPRSLVWVTRLRREEPIKAPPRPYEVARLSPDGTRLALDVRDRANDIWIWDLGRQTLTPLNLDPAPDMSPVWTPDGQQIVWTSNRGGDTPNLYRQAADGTGAIERLTTSGSAQFPTSISADGKRVALFMTTSTGVNLGLLAVEGGPTGAPGQASKLEATPMLQSAAEKVGAEISPDGRWMAYQSDESGQAQVYVRPFPNVDSGRFQISPNGGTRPAWARSGRELFYLDGNGLLTSVSVQMPATTLRPGTPARILDRAYYAGATVRGYALRSYDVSADGQRFLMIKEDAAAVEAAAPSASLVVILNWTEELKAKLPVR